MAKVQWGVHSIGVEYCDSYCGYWVSVQGLAAVSYFTSLFRSFIKLALSTPVQKCQVRASEQEHRPVIWSL